MSSHLVPILRGLFTQPSPRPSITNFPVLFFQVRDRTMYHYLRCISFHAKCTVWNSARGISCHYGISGLAPLSGPVTQWSQLIPNTMQSIHELDSQYHPPFLLGTKDTPWSHTCGLRRDCEAVVAGIRDTWAHEIHLASQTCMVPVSFNNEMLLCTSDSMLLLSQLIPSSFCVVWAT